MSARDRHQGEDAFERQISSMVSVTADAGDSRVDGAVIDVLKLVREHLDMDVAFVSEFVEERRVFRYVDQDDGRPMVSVGASDPVAMSFCWRVLDGRMPQMVRDVAALADSSSLPPTPFPVGAHLSTPIVLSSGEVYGMLCCFSTEPDETLTRRDLKRLQMAAEMVARLIDKSRRLDKTG